MEQMLQLLQNNALQFNQLQQSLQELQAAQQNYHRRPQPITPEQLYQQAETKRHEGDLIEAFKLYKQAGKQHHPVSCCQVGTFFIRRAEGNPVQPHYEKAAKWFRLAAQGGDNLAMRQLARHLAYGDKTHVPDLDEAIHWAKHAVATANPTDQDSAETCLAQVLRKVSDL